MANTYKIVRVFADGRYPNKVIKTGLTLKEAREHCQDPETSSKSCTTSTGRQRTERCGPWFDSYYEE